MAPAVTLRDVALASGVSTYTVSKVVAGQAAAARIAPATVERVLAKAAEMGYVPNVVARNLRAQRTGQIGVVLYEIHNQGVAERDTFEGALLRGLNVSAQAHGILPNVVYPAPSQESLLDPSRHFGSRIDGLLLWCVHRRHAAEMLVQVAPALPVVAMWYRDVPDHMGCVDIDHYGGALLAMEHLLSLGHRRIAYLGPDLDYDNVHFTMRCHAYHDALLAAGITPRPQWHAHTTEDVLALQRDADPITAVFAVQDSRAIALIATITANGGRIPEDLSIVGFDNIINADPSGGSLTTVHQPIAEMGALAVHHIAAMIKGAPVSECRTTLPARLVVRHTTARNEGGGR